MDELLIRRAQRGEPEAVEALMTGSESMIWRVCWHYIGERENTEDCAQEAMIRLWRSLDSFRFDCAFETWAYRIAANCSLDFLRKAKRRQDVPLEPLAEEGFDPADPNPGTEETVIRKEERQRLREAIAALPEDQRDALVLTQLEGKSYEEAARMMATTEGTIKSRVNRARGRLKELFSLEREQSGKKNVQRSETGSGKRGKPGRGAVPARGGPDAEGKPDPTGKPLGNTAEERRESP